MKFFVGFTFIGFILFIGNLLVNFIGINVGSTPLILMCSFIYALYIFNLLEILIQPISLKIQLISPPLVEENSNDIISLRVKNDFVLRKNFSFLWERSFQRGEVEKGEEKTFSLPYVFKKRGVEEFKKITLSFSGTLSLLYLKKTYSVNSKTLVYPTFYQTYRDFDFSQETGSFSSYTLSSQGEEIHSLRKYIPGDSLRLIAWKASAKKGELISKQLEKSIKIEPIFLLDDIIPKMDTISLEEFDQLLRFLHSFILSYIKKGLMVKIALSSDPKIFIPQNWDEVKIFLATLELKEGVDKNIIEDFDVVFSLDYNFWIKKGLQKKLFGVEFHKENVESLLIFRKETNPYDFINIWGTKNG